MTEEGGGGRGHRMLAHTAEVAFDVWAPSKDECIAEAVAAMVECFADVGDAVPEACVAIALDQGSDEDVLVAVLEEAIYQVETLGRVPVDVSVDERTGETEGRTEVRFALVPVETIYRTGAVPTGVSLHEQEFRVVGGLWRCHVIVTT